MGGKSVKRYDETMLVKEWQLRLFVTDWTPHCLTAYNTLKKVCDKHLENRCNIEIIDLLKHPELARQNQIVAIPTLIKLTPRPNRVMVGDLSNEARLLKSLDIEQAN